MITKFNDFEKITLSDLVNGNFKVKILNNNKYYKEFYIDDIKVASIHGENENLYIDNIMKIIKNLLSLTLKQIKHSESIKIKRLTKTSIKKAIRKYLEDLLYIDTTPVELSAYSWKDFK